MLKAMGIEDEKIDEIITAHSETVDALKEQRDQYKSDAEKLPNVQKELGELKEAAGKNGGSAWEVKYNAMKEEKERIEKDFTDFKTQAKAAETKAAKEKSYRAMLKEIGISEKRIDAVMKVTDLDAIDLDEHGSIKDADAVKATAMAEWSDFITSEATQGAVTTQPPKNTGGARMSMADIYKKDDHGRYLLNAEERQKAIAANLTQKG
jgi:hypothetical protein